MPAADPPTADAAQDTRPAGTEPPKAGNRGSSWRELPILVIIALALALLIKTFLVQAFYIPSASMENTLQGGNPTCTGCGTTPGHPFDRVLVNKLVYDFRSPHRGEVVVFKGPPRWPDETDFTAPGNPVARFFHDIGSAVGLAPSGGSDFIKRVIGVGGDTVRCSHDVLSVDGKVLHEPYLYPGSHPCSADAFNGKTVNGTVPDNDVIGRAFVVIWPTSDWRTLPIPSTFSQLVSGSSGPGATLVLVALFVVIVVGIIFYVVVRRRRRSATYPARDG
jgi:signal peptidase I